MSALLTPRRTRPAHVLAFALVIACAPLASAFAAVPEGVPTSPPSSRFT